MQSGPGMICRVWALALLIAATAGSAEAQSLIPDSRSGGKLLLTGGVSTIEGSGGGGLSTWATITGYGEEDGIGGNAHVTLVDLPAYQFRTAGLAVGLWDRVELSAARQEFDTGDTGALLGLGQGFTFTQDVIGRRRNGSWRRACWSAAPCAGPTPTRPGCWASAATPMTIMRPSSRVPWAGC
jgi:hypothetical protein